MQSWLSKLDPPKIDPAETDRCHGGCSYEVDHNPRDDPPDAAEYENRHPLSRSYELANDARLTEEFPDQFYKNNSPYGRACLYEVEPPSGSDD